MKIKVKDILELNPSYSERRIVQDVCQFVLYSYTNLCFEHERLNVFDYCHDTCNDLRARTAHIVCLDEVPTLFFQCVGKGNVVNINLLNEEKFLELRDLLIEEMKNEIDIPEVVEEVDLLGYDGSVFVVENNKLIAKWR